MSEALELLDDAPLALPDEVCDDDNVSVGETVGEEKNENDNKDQNTCQEPALPLEAEQGDDGEAEKDNLEDTDISREKDTGVHQGTENISGDQDIRILKGEIEQLRAELQRQSLYFERVSAECSEFCSLYPEVSMKTLPDGIWDDVRRGVPISAAYALYEKKREAALSAAALKNAENASRGAGGVGDSFDDSHYSADEVRAMSQSEVRRNYSKIIESMRRWN